MKKFNREVKMVRHCVYKKSHTPSKNFLQNLFEGQFTRRHLVTQFLSFELLSTLCSISWVATDTY